MVAFCYRQVQFLLVAASLTSTSKFLSLVLRHQPEVVGMQLDSEGWLAIDELIQNAELLPQGVSGAIKKRAGYQPFREVAKHGPIPLGGAVLTGAGRLPLKGIIHVAGISMWWRSSEFSIRESCRNGKHFKHKIADAAETAMYSKMNKPKHHIARLAFVSSNQMAASRPSLLDTPQGTMDRSILWDSWEFRMATVEERVEQLEKEVLLLKLSRSREIELAAKKPGWIAKIEGSFKDDPDFVEVLRLGREERKADILSDE